MRSWEWKRRKSTRRDPSNYQRVLPSDTRRYSVRAGQAVLAVRRIASQPELVLSRGVRIGGKDDELTKDSDKLVNTEG